MKVEMEKVEAEIQKEEVEMEVMEVEVVEMEVEGGEGTRFPLQRVGRIVLGESRVGGSGRQWAGGRRSGVGERGAEYTEGVWAGVSVVSAGGDPGSHRSYLTFF